ncbi:phosphotransferase enzyme family protein [Ktedonospora formicarum]|uniref:Spectinomycin phosphotransferase n=1 Tax=Ktedonospora formicarum TaxID=2778364 RepID=A0A8J3MPP6_9CHLR|nr:aminoglycoside phosphotransferase family protein [Ktedonospora formicarum]GHO41981.1 spectinomycin phosphotransferase [Ktedonospora formicarum]
MREQPEISAELLRSCLQEHYHLIPATLDFLPLGLDYRAGVYQIISQEGDAYLLKVRSGILYEPGCLVPAYLSEQGIAAVVAPLPTKDHALWAKIEDLTVIVYPFIKGETTWRGMTDTQWEETGSIFKQIHEVVPLSAGFESLRKETFDPTGYIQWIQMFETQHLHTSGGESSSQQALRSSWIKNQEVIHAVMSSLEKLAEMLQKRNLPFVICHADLHPANLLRAPSERVFVIDWDEVMLAPKERDFLFIKESPDASETLPGTPAFFHGYGQVEIDWIALTYYRYERVIQDVIACAENVCLRDDLGEGDKESEAQLFQDVLAEGGEIDAAIHVSAHLSPNPTVPIRRNAE